MTLLAAAAVGVLVGLGLGALGSGGSILAVPALVFLLGQSPAQATTGSLVVVAVTSVAGAASAHRAGNVLLARGAAFGAVAVGGAVVGARAAARVDETVLLAAFALVMLLVGALMTWRLVRRRVPEDPARPTPGAPILTVRPALTCACTRALAVLLTATLVGLLTGFLGVGGGFLVVPALLVALGLPLRPAVGTSLVVVAITSTAALAARAGSGVSPDWDVVLVLAVGSALSAVLGARLAARLDPRRLTIALTALVLAVAAYTASRALPALL